MLTIERVKFLIERIEEIKDDDGPAHRREDDLYKMIIEAIANNKIEDARKICRLALKTKKIDFCRWVE